MHTAELARRERALSAARVVLELTASACAAAEVPAVIPDAEGMMWNVRGEPRTRATFGLPHPDDFPGGLPLPPR